MRFLAMQQESPPAVYELLQGMQKQIQCGVASANLIKGCIAGNIQAVVV